MNHGSFATKAERVERLILDKRTTYEALGPCNGRMGHWIDTTQSVANGSQCSEVDVSEDCRDELENTVVDDVALGVKMGRMMKPGDQCFVASVDDSDGRHLHFFFIAPSEDIVVERLIAAFSAEVGS
jgi:hypothetical protein